MDHALDALDTMASTSALLQCGTEQMDSRIKAGKILKGIGARPRVCTGKTDFYRPGSTCILTLDESLSAPGVRS